MIEVSTGGDRMKTQLIYVLMSEWVYSSDCDSVDEPRQNTEQMFMILETR